MRYLLEAIEAKLAFTEDRAPELSEADREERKAALQAVFDHLLAATMPAHLTPTGVYALDDSGIDSAAGASAARRHRARPPLRPWRVTTTASPPKWS